MLCLWGSGFTSDLRLFPGTVDWVPRGSPWVPAAVGALRYTSYHGYADDDDDDDDDDDASAAMRARRCERGDDPRR